VAGLAYVRFAFRRQLKNDRRFLDELRARAGTLALRPTILQEKVSRDDQSVILQEHTFEGNEVLVGTGFLLPTYLLTAIHNSAVLPVGVEGITWSIQLDHYETRDDSLILSCTLPNDEASFTRLTFKGLLADGRQEAVLGAH
jgi:hypothetical protein